MNGAPTEKSAPRDNGLHKVRWTSGALEWMMLGILSQMFVASLVSWPFAPEKIPVHWNLRGEVDGYGGPFTGLFLLPLLTVGLHLLLFVLPRLDPRGDNYAQFAVTYRIIRAAVLLLMAFIHAGIILFVFGWTVNMSLLVSLLVGGLIILLGNYMGKIRPNWFVGVRTPWTLASKTSWVKTHRQARWVFIPGGLAIILTGMMRSSYALIAALSILVIGTIWLVIYSFIVWKNDTNRVSALETTPAKETNHNTSAT